MKVKLKKELRAEEMSVRILLAAAISLLCVSCIIEFVLRGSMCGYAYQSKHLDFFNNIALGLAGSALISFLSLWFQFLDRRRTQIRNVTSALLNIYADYTLIHQLIQDGTDPKFVGDNYSLERKLSNQTAALRKMISEAEIIYRNAAFTSEDVERVLHELQCAVVFNLGRIETFCAAMLPVSNGEPQEVGTGNASFSQNLTQDIIAKRARRDCCEYILSIIDQRCAVKDLETMLSKLGVETDLSSFAKNAIKDANKAVYDICFATLECKLDISIRINVARMFNCHTQEYLEEYCAIQKRLDEVVGRVDADKRTDPRLLSVVDEIKELARHDEISEAEKMIDVLEDRIIEMQGNEL